MDYGSVIFDMDGVLLDFSGEEFKWKYEAAREALEDLGVEAGKLSREAIDRLLGDRGESEFRQQVRELGLEPGKSWRELARSTTEARKRMIDSGRFQLYQDARPLLKGLRQERVATGMVSNAPSEAVNHTVESFDLKQLLKFYRGVTSYEDFHHRKPSPDHLELARAELKHGPFLYVGDEETDVEAARNAGMEVCWINRQRGSIDAEPDREVASLSELEQML